MSPRNPSMRTLVYLVGLIWSSIQWTSCVATSFAQAREHFQDVLFIVKYNFPAPVEIVLTHFTLWESVFKNFYIFIPWNAQSHRNHVERFYNQLTLRNTKSSNGIISFNTNCVDECLNTSGSPIREKFGCVAYNATVTAIKMYPQFTGYLFAHDDIAMNVSNLMNYNKSQMWIAPSNYHTIPQNSWDNPFTSEWWFRSFHGIRAIKQMYEKHPRIKQTMESCTAHNHTFYGSSQSDFFYIPKDLKSTFVHVANIFAENLLFLEIAVPTFGYCFINESMRAVKLKYCNPPRSWNVSEISKFCAKRDIVHPLKLTHSQNLNYIRQKMNLK